MGNSTDFAAGVLVNWLGGKIDFMLERREIEGRDPFSIAQDLTSAFDRFCIPVNSVAAQ